MHLKFRNINEAFRGLVKTFHTREKGDGDAWQLAGNPAPIVQKDSRNGAVLMIEEPVTITYEKPLERVLFNQVRDANPFFHVMEALWMLAGRNDVEPLAYYASNMRNYSDDGETLNGAYGYRWRKGHGGPYQTGLTTVPRGESVDALLSPRLNVDQLGILVAHLKADPNSRRAVLQMWNVADDLLKIGHTKEYADFEDYNNQPSEAASKDVCCLTGETRFRSPEGSWSISKLAHRFQMDKSFRFPVYTVDTETGDQRLGWMTNAWKVGVKPVYKVGLDDGSFIRLTGDHILWKKTKLFEGKRCIGISVKECMTCDLSIGDSVLATLSASQRKNTAGYYQFKRNVYKNTSYDNMVLEHREYLSLFESLKDYDTASPTGYSINHINGDKTCNRLTNLEQILNSEHFRKDQLGAKNNHTNMSKEGRERRGKIHSAVMRSGGKDNTPSFIREILNVSPKRRTEEQEVVLWEWVCTLSNHKVVSIERDGEDTVYDFTVPGRHNAVLDNGVLVHNCNLSVMFSLRGMTAQQAFTSNAHFDHEKGPRFLDMTVTNRSNDLIWGCLGANVVHFSFLQEYLAARIGVEVGLYHHFTNNMHVYSERPDWKPEEILRDATGDFYETPYPKSQRPNEGFNPDYCYEWELGRYVPLVKNPDIFERELKSIVGNGYGGGVRGTVGRMTYLEPFFETVAKPMFCAFEAYKAKEWEDAFAWVGRIEASDWKMAAKNWIAKRYAKRKGAADVPAGTE